jgi:hypothetical protein
MAMDKQELIINQHRKRFLRVVTAPGKVRASEVVFLEEREALMLGRRLHEVIRTVEEMEVQDWAEAKVRILETMSRCDSWVLFDNRWDVGAILVSTQVLRRSVEIFYQVLGPDFYGAAMDMSHGFVFDKQEYSFSLRSW